MASNSPTPYIPVDQSPKILVGEVWSQRITSKYCLRASSFSPTMSPVTATFFVRLSKLYFPPPLPTKPLLPRVFPLVDSKLAWKPSQPSKSRVSAAHLRKYVKPWSIFTKKSDSQENFQDWIFGPKNKLGVPRTRTTIRSPTPASSTPPTIDIRDLTQR